MADHWIALAFLNASLITLAPMSFGLGWASVVLGSAAGPRSHPDLLVLRLDRMPSSRDELRTAYRSAARKAHPDVHGGSQEAFLAVAGAFARLSEKMGGRVAQPTVLFVKRIEAEIALDQVTREERPLVADW